MEKSYSINDLALMSGFTTRTLRSYLEKGLLKGEKKDGAWSFSPEEVDRFFSDPSIAVRCRENIRKEKERLSWKAFAKNLTDFAQAL